MSFTTPYGFNFNSGIVVKVNYPTDGYAMNFTKILPEKPIVYFDNYTKFPRSKLEFINAKRTIKPENANIIILDSCARIQHIPSFYHVFYDLGLFYAIDGISYSTYFNNDVERLKTASIGRNLENPQLVYAGYLKIIDDPLKGLTQYLSGEYKAPYMLDIDLDRIIYNTFSLPTVNDLVSIYNMISSKDKNTIKLGLQVLQTFNIYAIPLTTRLIIIPNTFNITNFNVLNTSAAQLFKTMNIPIIDANFSLSRIQEDVVKYTEYDINLAKDVFRLIPNLREILKDYQPFFIDTLLFVPDEYKT